MAKDTCRREFLSRMLPKQVAGLANEVRSNCDSMNNSLGHASKIVEEARDLVAEFNNAYFVCFENCYPLLAECGAMLSEEAARLQIPVEGRSKMEIAKDIWACLDEPPPLLAPSIRTRDGDLDSNEKNRH